MTLQILSRRHGKSQQIGAALNLAWRQRRSLGHTNSRHEVHKRRQGFNWVLVRRHVRHKSFDVDKDSVTAGRTDQGYAAIEPAPEIIYLPNPLSQIRLRFKDLAERDRQELHRTGRQLYAVEKALHVCLLVACFVAGQDQTTGGNQQVF